MGPPVGRLITYCISYIHLSVTYLPMARESGGPVLAKEFEEKRQHSVVCLCVPLSL